MNWRWWRREEPTEVMEARERLEAIEADDVKVRNLEVRTQRIMRENNLAPMIMRALRLR